MKDTEEKAETSSLEKVNKLLHKNGVNKIIEAVLVGATAELSRYRLTQEINQFLGSDIARANMEHGMESFAIFLYIRGLEQLINEDNYKLERNMFIVLRLCYIFLLLAFENQQSYQLGRPLQVDQLVSSGFGMVLAQLFIYWQDRKESGKKEL